MTADGAPAARQTHAGAACRQRPDALELTRQIHAELVLQAHGKNVGAVTVSIGIAAFPTHGRTRPDLMRAADAALYRAKHGGRNRAVAAG